ncbi:hypothetical protein TI05_13340 [Achromatium sp. WMS3]|nr:hypothetical protein TI05_13340 [Achromatium sp. WMS3]
MLAQAITKVTAQEYLLTERASAIKHEFIDGEVFAMAGASKKHNQIASNLVRIIGNQILHKPCSIYSSDMRVKIEKANKYAYPDIVITCENEDFEDKEEDTLLNPIIIIEILSDSTESYDRGNKFFYYRQIDSFIEYILVSQKKFHIEKYTRQTNNSWLYSEFNIIDAQFELSLISCTISLQEVYDKVK